MSIELNFPTQCSPYQRATFRYTPLLPLLLSPTVTHPLLGKLLLVPISLAVPLILLWSPNDDTARLGEGQAPFWPTHLLWTLNPFVLNITTRGSPEAVIICLVVATIGCLRAAGIRSDHKTGKVDAQSTSTSTSWEIYAAILYALSISYKIYPVIYAPSIWVSLSRRHGWLRWDIWRFGMVTVVTMMIINGLLFSMCALPFPQQLAQLSRKSLTHYAMFSRWGQPFLHNTFLYHLSRLDHRHNLSPYFYSIYLSLFPSSSLSSQPILVRTIRHPLTSFIPQSGLVLVAGFLLTPRTGLVFAMFVQTALFVIFNKVCTSQVSLGLCYGEMS